MSEGTTVALSVPPMVAAVIAKNLLTPVTPSAASVNPAGLADDPLLRWEAEELASAIADSVAESDRRGRATLVKVARASAQGLSVDLTSDELREAAGVLNAYWVEYRLSTPHDLPEDALDNEKLLLCVLAGQLAALALQNREPDESPA